MALKKLIFRVLKNFKFLPVPTLLKIRHRYYTGKKLNLESPVEFNEKIQWLKLNYQNPLLTKLACKYRVREYVTEKIGESYLNELYGVYDNVENVNFDLLPNSFVLKGVHGSSLNLIVENKKELNIHDVKNKLNKWLSHNQYEKVGYEWAYKNIQPRIVCEKFLSEKGKDVLNDYKFFCFSGEPKFVQIDIDRATEDYRCYYDLNWNKLEFTTVVNKFYEEEVTKPQNFDIMIQLAKKLADSLPFARVDFYNIDGKVIFGEVTFYPADGKKNFIPEKYNKIIGDYINLPEPIKE